MDHFCFTKFKLIEESVDWRKVVLVERPIISPKGLRLTDEDMFGTKALASFLFSITCRRDVVPFLRPSKHSPGHSKHFYYLAFIKYSTHYWVVMLWFKLSFSLKIPQSKDPQTKRQFPTLLVVGIKPPWKHLLQSSLGTFSWWWPWSLFSSAKKMVSLDIIALQADPPEQNAFCILGLVFSTAVV